MKTTGDHRTACTSFRRAARRGMTGAVLLMSLGAAAAQAVEIPIDRTSAEAEPVTTVAYVDIEKVFAGHPMTERLRKEFRSEAERRRDEISGMRSDIEELQSVLSSSTTYVERLEAEIRLREESAREAPVPSTGTVDATRGGGDAGREGEESLPGLRARLQQARTALEGLRQDLEEKRQQLEALVGRFREDLTALEERQTREILSDIYRTIEAIARERDVSIVFDKSDILYGEPLQDLTSLVLERVK